MDPIPQHWTTAEEHAQAPDGRRYALRVWGWSTHSMTEAADVARDRAAELVQRLRRGGSLRRESYYPRLPLREELLREVRGADGTLIAAVTRNRYGAEVLNTDRLLIADVDLPDRGRSGRRPAGGGRGGFIARLLGRGNPVPDPAPPASPELDRIDAFAAARPRLGVHVYRTAAGYRVLITGSGAAPESAEAAAILRELSSDPVYVTLCATHRTYRARLTAKPWRVGVPALTVRWPWLDARTADRAARWLSRYTAACTGYAVCEKVRSGQRAPGPEEALVLAEHDRAVLGQVGAALA